MRPIDYRRDRKNKPGIFGPPDLKQGFMYGPALSISDQDSASIGITVAIGRSQIGNLDPNTWINGADVTELERHKTPERALLSAVLAQALIDVSGFNRIEKKSAERWIFSADLLTPAPRQDFDFSFSQICLWLDISPADLRRIVAARIYTPDPIPFSPKKRKIPRPSSLLSSTE